MNTIPDPQDPLEEEPELRNGNEALKSPQAASKKEQIDRWLAAYTGPKDEHELAAAIQSAEASFQIPALEGFSVSGETHRSIAEQRNTAIAEVTAQYHEYLIRSSLHALAIHHDFDLETIHRFEVVDGEVVLHCNSLYEYLKMALPDDESKRKVEANAGILKKLSSHKKEDLIAAIQEVPNSTDPLWVMDRINFAGSATEVKGVRHKVVIMNDIFVKKAFTRNRDGDVRERTVQEMANYEKDNRQTVRHEVQHVKYFELRGAHVQSVLESRKTAGNLSAREEQYLMVEFLTKDEIMAHIHNQLTPDGKIDWDGIKNNLKKSYAEYVVQPGEDLSSYEETVDELIDRTREFFRQEKVPEDPTSPEFENAVKNVMQKLIAYHPQQYKEFEKV